MSSQSALDLMIQYVPTLTELLCPPVPKFIINPAEKRGNLIDKTCAFRIVEVSFM